MSPSGRPRPCGPARWSRNGRVPRTWAHCAASFDRSAAIGAESRGRRGLAEARFRPYACPGRGMPKSGIPPAAVAERCWGIGPTLRLVGWAPRGGRRPLTLAARARASGLRRRAGIRGDGGAVAGKVTAW